MAKKQQWWTVIFGVITNIGNIDTFTVQQSGTKEQAVNKAKEAFFDEHNLEKGETLQLVGLIEGEHENDAFEYKHTQKTSSKTAATVNITIAYSPREDIYLYAVDTPSGSAPSWMTPSVKARKSVDATRSELERKYPTAIFTVKAGA